MKANQGSESIAAGSPPTMEVFASPFANAPPGRRQSRAARFRNSPNARRILNQAFPPSANESAKLIRPGSRYRLFDLPDAVGDPALGDAYFGATEFGFGRGLLASILSTRTSEPEP